MTEPQIISGPVVPTPGRMVYNVTLASGLVVTNPSGFGEPLPPDQPLFIVVPIPPISSPAPVPAQ